MSAGRHILRNSKQLGFPYAKAEVDLEDPEIDLRFQVLLLEFNSCSYSDYLEWLSAD